MNESCSNCGAAVNLTENQHRSNASNHPSCSLWLKQVQFVSNRTSWCNAMLSVVSSLMIALAFFAANPVFAAETTLPHEASISREAFEARYGKPLFSSKELDAVLKGIYGLGLDQVMAMLDTNSFGVIPAQSDALTEALKISGNKSDSLQESYTAMVPHVFVSRVYSNSIAQTLGLKVGDEILNAYLEIYGKWFDSSEKHYSESRFGSGETNGIARVNLPLVHWNLQEFHLDEVMEAETQKFLNEIQRSNGSNTNMEFHSAFCVETSRGSLRLSCVRIIEELLKASTNKIAPGFPPNELQAHYLDAIRKDAENSSKGKPWEFVWDVNQHILPSIAWVSLADIMPETRNLGAVFMTKFEIRKGLDKSGFLKAGDELKRVIAPKENHPDDNAMENLEPCEGFHWITMHRQLKLLKPVQAGSPDGIGSGLLGQMWLMREIMPSLDFAVYHGNGVDSLVFYDKDGVAICIQTLWGSEGGFITQLLPDYIHLPAILRQQDYDQIYQLSLHSSTERLLGVDCVPVQGVWCPMVKRDLLFMPKPVTGNGIIQFEAEPVDILNNPKRDELLNREYVSQFTNIFSFFNNDPAVAIQNNDLKGGVESKDSDDKLVQGIIDWPVDGRSNEHDSGGNLIIAGKNYTGQLMLREYREGYNRERFQVFGRTSLILPILTVQTIKAQKNAEAEKSYWNRYIEQMTGKSGTMTPAEFLEKLNRRQILEQLFRDKQ